MCYEQINRSLLHLSKVYVRRYLSKLVVFFSRTKYVISVENYYINVSGP